jgi:hypothetical protein
MRRNFLLIVALWAAGAFTAQGQIIAQDNAANYTSGWKGGQNDGTGFFVWVLDDNNGKPASDDYSGFFLSSSGTAAIDTSGQSFGLYANGPDLNESLAYRSFRAAVAVGQVFEVKFKNYSVATGGAAGISLFPGTRMPATNSLAGITSAASLSVYFAGGNTDYYLSDGNGVTDTGIPWNENGMVLEIAPLSDENYFLIIRSADGTTPEAVFVNEPFMNAGPIDGFGCYALNTGANGNVFFNQLEVASGSVLAQVTTNSPGLQFIEAEDYNFYGGNFIASPVPDEFGAAEDGLGALSTNAVAVSDVDAFKPSAPDGGTNSYRPQDSGRVDVNITSDIPRPIYAEQNLPDYSLLSVKTNEWEDYTRTFSNVASIVYARMLPVSGTPVMSLAQLAAPTATSSNQPATLLGTFKCPANATFYTNVLLTDSLGSPVIVQLNGTNTLRLTCLGGNYDLNYLVFVPVPINSINLVNPSLQPGEFSFSFQVPGARTNTVQFKNQLTDAVWQTLTNIPSSGAQVSVTDVLATNIGRFYRIISK